MIMQHKEQGIGPMIQLINFPASTSGKVFLKYRISTVVFILNDGLLYISPAYPF